MRKVNKLFPGVIAPDGEEPDVDFYVNDALEKSIKNPNKEYSDKELRDFFYFLRGDDKPFIIREFKDIIEPAEELYGKSNVGKDLPKHLQDNHEKGYLTK